MQESSQQWNEHDAMTVLAGLPGIGPATLRLISEYFGSYSGAVSRPLSELIEIVSAIRISAVKAFDGIDDLSQRLEQVKKEAYRHDAAIITPAHSDWPSRLASLESDASESKSPLIMYVRGNLSIMERKFTVAVVGSRTADKQSIRQTENIVHDLAGAGISIISGGASGVDSAAHRAALESGGHTVAVLGTSIEKSYPPSNRNLFREIVEHGGAVVSEMPPGTGTNRGLFSRRNRIISGLADLVLVVSGRENSGTLSTARHAFNQNRPVCAIPGDPRRPLSACPNRLLVQGAGAVLEGRDVVRMVLELRGDHPDGGRAIEWLEDSMEKGEQGDYAIGNQVMLTPGAKKLLERLECLPRNPDSLADGTGLSGAEVAAALVELEIAGLAEKVAGGYILAGIRVCFHSRGNA